MLGQHASDVVLHVPSLLTMVVDAVAPSSPCLASSTPHAAPLWLSGGGSHVAFSYCASSAASLRSMMTWWRQAPNLNGSKVSAVIGTV